MDDTNHTDQPAAPSETPATAETPSGDSAATGQPLESKPPTSDQVKMALRKVKDPELNLNIIDLGLVYEIAVDGSDVQIDMTLTSPGCPAGPEIMGDVEFPQQVQPPRTVGDAGKGMGDGGCQTASAPRISYGLPFPHPPSPFPH